MDSPSIGIIGSGGMGRGIARRFATAGHVVTLHDHKPDAAIKVAEEAGNSVPGSVQAGSLADAMSSDVVVMAVWYPGTVRVALENVEALAGKIVVDIANPLDETFTALSVAPDSSAAEELAEALPDSTIVKAFNTVPAPTLYDGMLAGTPLDTFVSSDSETAKQVLLNLLARTGLRGIDAGKLANARLLERLTAFGIELGQRHGLGFEFGIKYLPDGPLTRG
jgi:NADPH-dependent F420 reductase